MWHVPCCAGFSSIFSCWSLLLSNTDPSTVRPANMQNSPLSARLVIVPVQLWLYALDLGILSSHFYNMGDMWTASKLLGLSLS